jgi:OOP family OmpA-OmpF porin
LKNFPEVKVEIQGHSDSMGDDAYNLSLSQKRAESVMTYLTTQGVPAAQLTAKGYGESAPIADNKTAAGRA